MIDLHIHSTASDGKFSPKELIDLAIKNKIPAIALTDHNRTSGNKEAEEYAAGKIEFIPGIEITITPPKGSRELHMVGLFIDSENKDILKVHEKSNKYAQENAKKIIKNLNKLGYKITFEEILNKSKKKHFGRPTIAEILMENYPKSFKDRSDVFDQLLGQKGKAFVEARGYSLKKAIKIIHKSGGIAIIAHPWHLGENMEKIIKRFSKFGGDGIEIGYSSKDSNPKQMDKMLRKIANDNKLIISGGTDFHNFVKGGTNIGEMGLTKEEFIKLKEYYKNKFKRK